MQVSNANYSRFINYLSTQQALPSVQTMATQLNLSSRKIYYLLQSANTELRAAHLPFLVPETEIASHQLAALTSSLSKTPVNTYLNSYERQLIIDTIISLPFRKWTLSDFQALFSISRNTVLRDVSVLKKRAKFKPVFSKKDGFHFEEPLYDLLVHAYNNLTLLQYHKCALDYFINTLDKHIAYSKFLLVSDKLKHLYKNSIDKQISNYNAITFTLFTVSASLYDHRHPIQSAAELFKEADIRSFTKRQEFNIIKDFSLIVMTNFDLSVSEPLELFLTLQLLSVNKEQDAHFSSHDFQDLLILSESLVNVFFKVTQMSCSETDRKALIRDIQTQLKPFWYAVRYQNITVYDYLYVNPTFEHYVQQSLDRLNKQPLYIRLFPFGLLPEQIRILAMIFYNFSLSQQKIHKINILMITSLPIYSQKLLQTIIEHNTAVLYDLTIRRLPNRPNTITDINDFNLLITESTEIYTTIPTFLIDQQLKDSEFERLKKVIEQL